MGYKKRFYPETEFGGFTEVDGTIAFFSRIQSLLKSEYTVLEVGCGRAAFQEDQLDYRKSMRIFNDKVQKVIGIDIDPRASENPYIDEFHLLTEKEWPIKDESIDMIVCDYVLEHVEYPEPLFMECNRVLKPGGYICMRTPNKHSYISFATRVIPNKHHAMVTSVVQDGRKEEDVFPTYFRANSKRKLNKLMKKASIDGVVIYHESEPSYLQFSKIAYFIGVLHQRWAPWFLKPVLFIFGKKV